MIRNKTTNTYDYYLINTTNWAGALVTGGGGSDATVQGQIAAGT